VSRISIGSTVNRKGRSRLWRDLQQHGTAAGGAEFCALVTGEGNRT
jgi:hypothetical protein